MAARLGDILYWLGCGVSALSWLWVGTNIVAMLWFGSTTPDDTLVHILVFTGAALASWAIGRACQYILAGA